MSADQRIANHCPPRIAYLAESRMHRLSSGCRYFAKAIDEN